MDVPGLAASKKPAMPAMKTSAPKRQILKKHVKNVKQRVSGNKTRDIIRPDNGMANGYPLKAGDPEPTKNAVNMAQTKAVYNGYQN